jgi:hypothetical protein
MSTAFTTIGSKLVERLLPQEEAGACTRCPGPCSFGYYNVCYTNGQMWYSQCSQVYTCDCGCVPTTCSPISYVGPC